MMKKIYFTVIFTFISLIAFSQNIGINEAGALPDNSAALDVDFTDRGVLIPRMTTNQRNAIPNPAHSLLIFNTTTDCFNAYNSYAATWADFGCACIANQAQSDFSWNSTASGQNITFTPNDMTAISYSWTFAQATPGVSNAQVPSNIVWANSGTYNVTLVATFAGGCYTTTKSITIQDMQTFSYTGTLQTFTVPQGVNTVFIEVWGAEGGDGGPSTSGQGGLGGYAEGDLSVTPGEVLEIYVGGQGQPHILNTLTGGWNGGGGTYATSDDNRRPGSGGGASDVRQGGSTLANRVIVAGGGGGSGGWQNTNGGVGGGLIGGDGQNLWGGTEGKGGTQFAGGTGHNAGMLGVGGRGQGNSHGGGGGGGGYYGGGGGRVDAGGGGSSYIGGVTNASTTSGIRAGDGQVIIYY